MFNSLFTIIFVLGVILNGYKILLMFSQPYYICPWLRFFGKEPNVAKMTSLSLLYHNITALLLSYVAWYWCTTSDDTPKQNVYLCHLLFCIGILPNLTKLGSAPWLTAFMINGSILSGMTYALYASHKSLYFGLLSTPVIVEALILFALTLQAVL